MSLNVLRRLSDFSPRRFPALAPTVPPFDALAVCDVFDRTNIAKRVEASNISSTPSVRKAEHSM